MSQQTEAQTRKNDADKYRRQIWDRLQRERVLRTDDQIVFRNGITMSRSGGGFRLLRKDLAD